MSLRLSNRALVGIPALACLLALLAPAPADAHGGLHQSQAVVPTAEGPVVVSTYGLVATNEDGDWQWVCEEVAQAGSSAWTFGTTPQGSWLMATIDGLVRSPDRCVWTAVQGPLWGRYVTAVLGDAGRGGTWALTGSSAEENPLWWSQDDGQTWTAGPLLHPTARLRSIAIESDGRLWVQGMDGSMALLWTSPDGETWTEQVIDENAFSAHVFAAAGGVAWLSLAHEGAPTRLLRVLPGQTPTAVWEGETLDAVDAGPDPDEVWLSAAGQGTQRSRDGGETWAAVDQLGDVACLVNDGSDRWACTDNWADGAAVKVAAVGSTDFVEALWFGDVRSVADCPADSTTRLACDPLWADLDPLSGFDQERDSGEARVGGDAPGCSCGGRGAAGLLPWVGLAAWRRRLRRKRAEKVPGVAC